MGPRVWFGKHMSAQVIGDALCLASLRPSPVPRRTVSRRVEHNECKGPTLFASLIACYAHCAREQRQSESRKGGHVPRSLLQRRGIQSDLLEKSLGSLDLTPLHQCRCGWGLEKLKVARSDPPGRRAEGRGEKRIFNVSFVLSGAASHPNSYLMATSPG